MKIRSSFISKRKLGRVLPLLAVVALCIPAYFATAAVAATPVITNIAASNILTTGATVTWTTDIPADSQVEYGLTTSYGSSTALNSSLVSSHSQAITGLQANRLYHFRVKSRDASGDLAVSSDRTFITASGTTTPGGLTDSSNSNTMNATRFTTVNGGKLVSLSAHVGSVDGAVGNRSFQLAIYTANGTVPGNLVASTTTGTLTANSWNTVPINATLAPNTSYFIAYNTNGTSSSVNNLHYVNGGTSVWSNSGQTFGAWPASFGAATAQSATFSMYASYISDTTPPQVSITAPASGATVTGTVDVQAAASDDNAIAGVQFKLDGNNLGTEDTSAPYSVSWNTALLVNGSRTLTAVATDTAGNVTTSQPVTVNLSNPPKIIVTHPTPGQNISGSSVTITYTKTGDWLPGDGKHAHFRLDGGPTKMDFDTDNDQTYVLTAVPGGNHTLESVVADGSHNEFAGSGGTVSFTTTVPDTTPPTVTVTAPASGATVSNTVTVTADATDNVGVLGVQFLLDGSNLGSEDTATPYSASWNTTTTGNGTHTLTARARDSVNQTTSGPVTVTVQNTDPRAAVGEWSPVMNWPLVAVHTSMLYTGEILMWDAWETPITHAKLWNPTTNVFTEVPVTSAAFCSGHASTASGEVAVLGGYGGVGQVGVKDVSTFNPVTKTWTRLPDMQFDRWYPSVTQMADNRMVIFSGQIYTNVWANTPEIFNPATGTTSTVPVTTPQLAEGQYPQTSLIPSGKVLAISSEHGSVMLFNPANSAWTNIGTSQVPYGIWTSFAPGKYLITGGATNFDNPGLSQTTARVLDVTNDTAVWSNASNMYHARAYHNVTMLPDGKALAVGGSITADRSTTGTLTAEEWDPATSTWTEMANPAKPRMYHSTSLLLPDGRVLSAGGGRLAPMEDQTNAQIFSPPYLFQGPRPTIGSAPNTMTHNSTMDITSPDAANISKITLANLGSVTHTADWSQHFMELPFTRNGNTLTVNAPANAKLAPEGYYMVFLVNSSGVPSQAKIVKLLGTPDTTPPVISGVQAANIGGTTVTANWTTSEPADSQVEYGATTAYGSSTTLDSTLQLSHSQSLVGLTPNTLYHYRVKSRDPAGNLAVSGDNTFTTTGGGAAGLVAAYSFNEGSGSTVADASGNSNNGSIFQAAWYTSGKFGQALSFDGSNDTVTVNDANSLDLTNGMTLEAWVRPTTSSGGWRTAMLKENGSELAYGLYAKEDNDLPSGWIRVNPTIGGSQSAGAGPGLPVNTWTHLAVTYDGSSIKLYVNGTLRAEAPKTGNMYTSNNPLRFGGNAVWGEYFSGQLDEIRVYNRPLGQAEVQTDMNTAI